MSKKNQDVSITPRAEDYSQWYLDVIAAADLSENSPTRGCMIIKPYGYALWENMKTVLDQMFKATGVENAYFPLLIPMSFLTKEADHVEGFATECAVVTHHRLEKDKDGKMVPAGKLEEPYVIRPTSETIINDAYSKWIESHRDLPVLINQWANVMRWEMRTRPFLRTSEFLWQEGHTAHATKKEAEERTAMMLGVYQQFAEEYMAMPVIPGTKSESERFAGADNTLTIEAMMQDTKALQAGTSHMLGQNFAKGFDITFQNEEGVEQHVWQTSWGVSTRLIGGLIMTHSDDKGLVLPPNLAPIHVVIVPIMPNDAVLEKAAEIHMGLAPHGIHIKVDNRDMRPGPRFFEWEKKGVPIRIEIGPKDIEKGSVVMVRRDTGEKLFVNNADIVDSCVQMLESIQHSLYDKAEKHREDNTHRVDSYDEFKKTLEEKGGFIHAHWCGDPVCEAKIKEETKASTRCIPLDGQPEDGKCVYCEKPSKQRIIFAKAY